jgi:hypothetical protein
MPVIYHERRRHPTWTRTSRTGLTAIPRDVHADAVAFAVDGSGCAAPAPGDMTYPPRALA